MASQKLRLAIVGGGIGGLTMAVALSRLDVDDLIEVDVYEATPKMTQVGAGITIWPRGWTILRALGLEQALAALMPPGQEPAKVDSEPRLAFTYRKSDEREGSFIGDLKFKGRHPTKVMLAFRQTDESVVGGSSSFHRAEVQDVLLSGISSSIRFHLSCRLSSYKELGRSISLEFENGRTATCDLLVGADGIKSVVRKILLSAEFPKEADKIDPVWSGTFIYRSLIDSDTIKRSNPNHRALTTPTVYCGKNKHVVVYPVMQGKLLNTAAFYSEPEKEGAQFEGPPVIDTTKDNIASHYVGWEEEVRCLVDHMDKPSRWAIQTSGPLSQYALRGVALLGDAAHAMTPHQGNGAGQALEDAYILANVISKAVRSGTPMDISKVTGIYSKIRQPFGNFVQSSSRVQGLLYEMNGPGFEDINEGDSLPRARLDELADRIQTGWEWVWTGSPTDDLERAFEMM